MVRYLKRKAHLSQHDMRRGMTKYFAFKSLLSTYIFQKLFILVLKAIWYYYKISKAKINMHHLNMPTC